MAKKEKDPCDDSFTNTFWAIMCYINLLIFSKLVLWFRRKILRQPDRSKQPGYAPLYDDYGAFYIECIYSRIDDSFTRPIASKPGPWIEVMDRTGFSFAKNLGFTGNVKTALNLGSYNYLGFADDSALCLQDSSASLEKYSTTTAATRVNFGTTTVHLELERLVARFVGKEDAVIFGMGYATNSTTLPSLVGKGGLIISDTLNHASLIVGIRSSVAEVRVFKHNDPKHLEHVLREAILNGQPRTRKPWTKILIVIEGIYSMEGEICRLPEIIAVKNKYKAYLYVDEAHSIGALGKRGRGVCDYWGVNPEEVDLLMGTFTKSFGSAGGYIAGSKELISNIRATSFSSVYDTSMSVPCAQQIITSMKIIMGEQLPGEGAKRLEDLRNNSVYFRRRLKELGFWVFGDNDSPIIPVMLYSLSTMVAFSRLCMKRNIAVVVAGYPATPLLLCRARFCMSAAHTKEDLEWALAELVEVGNWCGVRSKELPGTIKPKKSVHKRATTVENRELVALAQ
eukprot:TRINITY_DN1585_c0_g1_i1.p1 TRINITY_DN1585_c0_g1~~TRINITY_DN1585_c0_g1_i1.p1  ORF type:complete len:510 (+),score=87.80 TRINITY_DN1585_c0_g1_i1:268-1797(+)